MDDAWFVQLAYVKDMLYCAKTCKLYGIIYRLSSIEQGRVKLEQRLVCPVSLPKIHAVLSRRARGMEQCIVEYHSPSIRF